MSNKHEQGGTDVRQKNVYLKPLHQHSNPRSSPSTSVRDSSMKPGFCTEQAPIASILTDHFLDFSNSRGIDLRKQGINPGHRLCVEASTWKEAVDAGTNVGGVKLDCTHESALKSVGFDVLRKYAAEQDHQYTIRPDNSPGKSVRESREIGGREPKA